MKQTAERKTDKTKWLILLLALITVIAVGRQHMGAFVPGTGKGYPRPGLCPGGGRKERRRYWR